MECQAPNHRFNLSPIFATNWNKDMVVAFKKIVLNKEFIEIKEGISFEFEYN